VNYTNFNTCWERRAQRQPLGLGAREGRRFGFRSAPAPECEVDGPAHGLRPAEVRKLEAAGVIGFPAQGVPAAAPVAVVSAKDRVVRQGRPIKAALQRLIQSGREFSAADVPDSRRNGVMSALSRLHRLGRVELVRPGKKGTRGTLSLYRGVKGPQP
jgi:hypothetical protein